MMKVGRIRYKLLSVLGSLYVLHLLTVHALVAQPFTFSSVDYSDYQLYKTESKAESTTKTKPFALFMSKSMVACIKRIAQNNIPVFFVQPDLELNASPGNDCITCEQPVFTSIADDTFKRYRLNRVFLI